MNLEIHRPELVQRVNAQIQRRHLNDVDELLEQALDALDEKSPAPTNRTGAVVLEALQARPYPDIDFPPQGCASPMCGMSCSDGMVAGYQYPVGEAQAKTGTRVTAFYETQPLDTLYISVVNIAEIRFGIELQPDVTRRAELNAWLARTLRPAFAGRILPVTEDILLRWRALMEDGRENGHTYSHPDLVLAATALQHGLTVVTHDRSDFDKAGVPVFNPWELA